MPDLSQRLSEALGDRYRIERTLGRGGMATVFLAEDLRHRRPVAIKVLDPEVATAIGPERFLREIETVARLRHPHILPLFDSGAVNGLFFYVMPLAEGESLRQRLEREKQLPIAEALQIAREVADALEHAHRHGIVHRDIKPENVLLEQGHAVVVDFGIARTLAAAGTLPLTATGVAMGTPAYMSPEQAAGSGAVDGRSDQYALGCVLYEMLAGAPPFTAPTAENLLYQHLNVAPRLVTELRAAVSAEVARALATALAKTPADRFATIAGFAAALAAVGTPAPGPAPVIAAGAPGPAVARRRPGWIAATVAAVAIAGAGLAAWQGWWPFAGRSAAPVSGKDWILVAEFDGPPGDSTLAPAARSLLSAALDQSRIVATVPPDQIRAALAAAGKPKNTRVDAEVAKELAYRSAVRAVLEGTIGRLGKGYSVVVKVVDADTSRAILTRSGTAKDEDALIPALDEMAKQLRRGLGENRNALRATRAMTLVATPSFEAYRLYNQANLTYLRETSNREALRLYRAALALDPDFATAWLGAVNKYLNLGLPDSAGMCIEEALRRPGRLTNRQRQRLAIVRAYAEGDTRGAVAEYDRILSEDPGDLDALSWSNDALLRLGRTEEALERTRRAMRLSPFGASDGQRINETWDLQLLGRFDEARAAAQRQTGIWRIMMRAGIEVAAGEFTAAESIAAAHLDDPHLSQDLPDGLRSHLSATQFGRGAVDAAARTLKESGEILRRAGHPTFEDLNRRGWIEYSVISDGALPLPPEAGSRDITAATLLTRGLRAAVTGDHAVAGRCLQAARARPRRELRDDVLASVLLEARLEAIAGRPEKAVRLLRPFATPFLGQGVSLTWTHWWLADAFEQMARPDSAAHYLERIWSVAFEYWDGAEKPYAHRRLAVLYARMGKLAEAERHLAAAEMAWDRPDPEIRRMLEEARAAVRAARGMARPASWRR